MGTELTFNTPDVEQDNPQCIHCAAYVHWTTDLSPDLCKACAGRGLLSPMWDADQAARHAASQQRLAEAEQRFNEIYDVTSNEPH